MTLFNGLQGFNSMKMNRASYMMNKENLEAMEDNITLQVMTGYLDLLKKPGTGGCGRKKGGGDPSQVDGWSAGGSGK